jgi:hypothetical protein
MGKPVVRIALDRDILLKLLPEGDLDAQIAFDNSVIQLIKETSSRIAKKSIINGLEGEINKAIASVYGRSYHKEDDLEVIVKNSVEAFAKDLIDRYYQTVTEDNQKRIKDLFNERFAIVEKLIIQMTSPEEVEKLMVKACAAIVKGSLQ